MRFNYLLPAFAVTVTSVALAVPASASYMVTWTNTTNNVTYEITTLGGTFESLFPQLHTQPWWGSSALALDAAALVGNAFGNQLDQGCAGCVFFAYAGTEESAGYWDGTAFSSYDLPGESSLWTGGKTETNSWAIATPISALINLDGTDYNVSITNGTFLNLSTLLQANPWWNNSSLAYSAANQVANKLPLDPSLLYEPDQGPFFGYQLGYDFCVNCGLGVLVSSYPASTLPASGVYLVDSPPGGYVVPWAVATPVSPAQVPTPALLPGLIGMGIATLRKSKAEG
jgi:hypothetical protein